MWMLRGYFYLILKSLALNDSVNQVITGFEEIWLRSSMDVLVGENTLYGTGRDANDNDLWRTVVPLQRLSNAFRTRKKRVTSYLSS